MKLQFDRPVEDPRDVATGADLVLGADGIHSDTCETYADELGARTIDGSARFSWFGTNADFDAANTPSTAGNART